MTRLNQHKMTDAFPSIIYLSVNPSTRQKGQSVRPSSLWSSAKRSLNRPRRTKKKSSREKIVGLTPGESKKVWREIPYHVTDETTNETFLVTWLPARHRGLDSQSLIGLLKRKLSDWLKWKIRRVSEFSAGESSKKVGNNLNPSLWGRLWPFLGGHVMSTVAQI